MSDSQKIARAVVERIAQDITGRGGLWDCLIPTFSVPDVRLQIAGEWVALVTPVIEEALQLSRIGTKVMEQRAQAAEKERDDNTRRWHLLLQDIHAHVDPEGMDPEILRRLEIATETGCVPDCGSCQRSIEAERERDELRLELTRTEGDRERLKAEVDRLTRENDRFRTEVPQQIEQWKREYDGIQRVESERLTQRVRELEAQLAQANSDTSAMVPVAECDCGLLYIKLRARENRESVPQPSPSPTGDATCAACDCGCAEPNE